MIYANACSPLPVNFVRPLLSLLEYLITRHAKKRGTDNEAPLAIRLLLLARPSPPHPL